MCDAGTNAEHGEDAAIVKRRMADMAITTCERVGVQDALIIFALRLYVNTDAKQDEVRNNCDRMARELRRIFLSHHTSCEGSGRVLRCCWLLVVAGWLDASYLFSCGNENLRTLLPVDRVRTSPSRSEERDGAMAINKATGRT